MAEWKAFAFEAKRGKPRYGVSDQEGTEFYLGYTKSDEAKAIFIARACNAHDALLEAAKALLDALDKRSVTATEYDALRKAVALAEGGKDGGA